MSCISKTLKVDLDRILSTHNYINISAIFAHATGLIDIFDEINADKQSESGRASTLGGNDGIA